LDSKPTISKRPVSPTGISVRVSKYDGKGKPKKPDRDFDMVFTFKVTSRSPTATPMNVAETRLET
jgi:hypothetical protein